MSERKYKVGDVVRTLTNKDMYGNKLFPKGTIGTITNILKPEYGSALPYKVEARKDWWYYSADMIEPVDEDGIPKHEMTREETIERLQSIKALVDKYDDVVALREAIKALSQQTEDAISRRAVFNIIEKEQFKGDAIAEIEKLPPANSQEPKTGHWILHTDASGNSWHTCPACGHIAHTLSHYCPDCGMRLEAPS